MPFADIHTSFTVSRFHKYVHSNSNQLITNLISSQINRSHNTKFVHNQNFIYSINLILTLQIFNTPTSFSLS